MSGNPIPSPNQRNNTTATKVLALISALAALDFRVSETRVATILPGPLLNYEPCDLAEMPDDPLEYQLVVNDQDFNAAQVSLRLEAAQTPFEAAYSLFTTLNPGKTFQDFIAHLLNIQAIRDGFNNLLKEQMG